ncbi:MAG: ribonuclease T2 [Rhodobacteraceae bacterium]|nr:ribonuclease T2 [Paracoccaceae bacterium]
MRKLLLAIGLACLPLSPALGEEGRAGSFDYYILSLGWSPSWCATTSDARDATECRPHQGKGFTLHGLWPQYEQGWPSDCRSAVREATRAETAAMTDLMGSAGLAWHEWKKHGRCSGLPAADYFALARRAYGTVTLPPLLAHLSKDIRLPASLVEKAFLDANPRLAPDMLTITCEEGRIAEVRLCLRRDLTPRSCGGDALRDCRAPSALMEKRR